MGFQCPTCDSEFDTRRGLGVHHTLVHDEQLPNRNCAECGEEFYCSYEKKYCSRNCRYDNASPESKEKRSYRRGKECTDCRICGATFEYYASNKEGLYCPDCVENESWRSKPDISGSKNPRWNGGKIEVVCAICDTAIKRYPSNFTSDMAVCSEECRQAWLSRTFTGPGHPNWKGGGNESYGTGWQRVRKQALERDGYACVRCSKTKQELGRNPDVHHIVSVRSFAESKDYEKTDAHYLENVVSLCIACHRKADFGKISEEALRSLIDG